VKKSKMPAPRRAGTLNIEEWADLGTRLAIAGPEKYEEIVSALREIVDAQETIAQFDWQLLFGKRPSKRYQA
jgi:hypothetical protein